MPKDFIPFKDTGYFSSLICDYLDEKEDLKQFYSRIPNIENFRDQIYEKKNSFSKEHREVIKDVIKNQYQKIDTSELTKKNIDALAKESTFTVTTGHQLNLFTGPLYFLYKIISTINLTKELKLNFPDFNFVPVYWMATEDHDFDEINFFNFQDIKVSWNRESNGVVGKLSTEGLDEVLQVFSEKLGTSPNAKSITELFRNSYV
ncbi:MAG: bacillithiol biosynthesis cysteine-adding enzyme BshC, partial [Bacteroidia bacterium]|nr:bacillithiol biosynthesis cysteine-adding enzyme BshC [Bacteroidia bacterium]